MVTTPKSLQAALEGIGRALNDAEDALQASPSVNDAARDAARDELGGALSRIREAHVTALDAYTRLCGRS
jgi:hypothetical protein